MWRTQLRGEQITTVPIPAWKHQINKCIKALQRWVLSGNQSDLVNFHRLGKTSDLSTCVLQSHLHCKLDADLIGQTIHCQWLGINILSSSTTRIRVVLGERSASSSSVISRPKKSSSGSWISSFKTGILTLNPTLFWSNVSVCVLAE